MLVGDVIAMHDANEDWKDFQVGYPEDRCGNFAIEIFHIPTWDKGRIRIIKKQGPNRDPGSGTFRRLVETLPGVGQEGADGRRVWMSDTRAEIREHAAAILRLQRYRPKRVLINGLGIGLVVQAASRYAEQVDVVELNQDVAAITQKHMPENVRVYLGDAYSVTWPRGTRWDMAWHDIWPQISDENIPQMRQIMARYRGKTPWQGCWQWEGSLKMFKMMQEMEKGTLDPMVALKILTEEFRP